jgi:mycothiol synthase
MNPIGTLRPASDADADAILALNLVRDLAVVGEPATTIAEVEADLACETIASAVLDGAEGDLVAYVWVDRPVSHSRTWGSYVVRPGTSEEVEHRLVDWLVATARDLGPGRPIHTFCDSSDHTARRLYEQAGGEIVRRFWRMGIGFDGPPAPPALPPGVEIRGVESTPDDLRTMYRLIDTSFLDHFGYESETYEEWREFTVDGAFSDLSLWRIATVDGEAAAGLIANAPAGYGYVDALGTLRQFRGRGVGRALLLASFGEFYRRGLRRAVLGVDSTSPTGAVGLYESVGMTAEHLGLRYELPA